MTQAYQSFAISIAQQAGKIIMSYWRKLDGKENKIKHHRELVTRADLAANKFLVSAIRKNFPTHGIIAEESAHDAKSSAFSIQKLSFDNYVWTVDPLDGTNNFAMGFPIFSVAIGLMRGNQPVMGVIYNPLTRDLYFAQKGKGAYLNKKQIRVSKTQKLSQSEIIFCHGTGKNDFAYDRAFYSRIQPAARACRMWGAAGEEFGAVARGGAEAFIFTSSTSGIWDFVPGVLLVHEAGGKITDAKGVDWYVGIKPHKNAIIASNKILHSQLLKIMQ